MKAVRIHRFGGPEVLKQEEVPKPSPGPGQVLVRVHAASVNPVDYKMREGVAAQESQLPLTLGKDIAGSIEKLGAAVSEFDTGDEVYAMLPRDKGGYAEFVALDAELCAHKPRTLDFVEAAAVPLAALTAWQGLFDLGGLKPGQTVLIHGASGGVGHFAVQFARAKGATVIAVCRGEDRDFVNALGAARVIDYQRERFEDIARDVDLVFDLVAGEAQDRSWSVIKEGGALVSTLARPDAAKAAEHGVRAMNYLAQPHGEQLAEIARLIDDGEVKPCIDRVYPLNASAEAERRLQNEHVRGKVVLTVA